jgi:hypothetical protein
MLNHVALAFASNDLGLVREHDRVSGNLAELLRFAAEQYHVPVIAELVYPVPEHILIDSGHDAIADVLAKLCAQAPGYTYEVKDDRVIHFHNVDITNSKGNWLNVRIKSFMMPPNVSDFKLLLPAAINSARKGLPPGGAVISGFPSTVMKNEKLQTRELMDVSARELLLTAAEESRGFYSIVVFQDQNCQSDACFDYAMQHWIWGPLTERVSKDRIYIQHPRS